MNLFCIILSLYLFLLSLLNETNASPFTKEQSHHVETLQKKTLINYFLGEWKIYKYIRFLGGERQDFLIGNKDEWIGVKVIVDFNKIKITKPPEIYNKYNERTFCKIASDDIFSREAYDSVSKEKWLCCPKKISFDDFQLRGLNIDCDETPLRLYLFPNEKDILFQYLGIHFFLRRVDPFQINGDTVLIKRTKSWKKASTMIELEQKYKNHQVFIIEKDKEYWVFIGYFQDVIKSHDFCNTLKKDKIKCMPVVVQRPKKLGESIQIKKTNKNVFMNLGDG